MTPTTVIFDMDGTLLSTLEDLKDAVNYALSEKGYDTHTLDEMRRYFGNGIAYAIKQAEPGLSEKELAELVKLFRSYYGEHCMDKTCPYPGIPELVKKLSEDGYKMAIVSNKVDSAVKELAKKFFPEITVAIGERTGIRRKPAPDTVIQALEELGVTKEESVYIGDSEVDLATARATGLPCISVLWGFREKSLLEAEGATCFVESTEEIPGILRNMV
jgi:phosphoglycolate phosphatase